MSRKMKAFSHEDGGSVYVWAEDISEPPVGRYRGPATKVTHDDAWLYIKTDPYDGVVMLNIEALPALRKALAKIAKARKKMVGDAGFEPATPAV